MEKGKIRISLIFLLIVAVAGSLIRFIPFGFELIPYKNILHAHSHVGFQGWVYTGLFLILTHGYIGKNETLKGKYKLQFNITLFVIIGILISFLYQSYGLFSIVFSSLFQLISYWFIYNFFKYAKSNCFSLKVIKCALVLNLISTLAPWVLGIIVAKGYAETELYHSTIYFFLHFQYNGWFLFSLIGLLFWVAENYNITFNIKKAKTFYQILLTAVFPTYFLSLLGMSFRNTIFTICIFGCILLLFALVYFFLNFKPLLFQILHKLNGTVKLLILLSLILLFVKILLQVISVIPSLEYLAFHNKYIIMAYIHLSTIGVYTFFLLGYLFQFNWLKCNLGSKVGIYLLIIGFVITELILIFCGLSIFINNYEFLIFIFSSIMALGITSILVSQYLK